MSRDEYNNIRDKNSREKKKKGAIRDETLSLLSHHEKGKEGRRDTEKGKGMRGKTEELVKESVRSGKRSERESREMCW